MNNVMNTDQLFEKSKDIKNTEVIIDCRTREEFAAGHIEGAINYPLDELLNHVDALKKYERIYLHCRSGGRAMNGLQQLQGAGLQNITCIQGGMLEWEARAYPTKK